MGAIAIAGLVVSMAGTALSAYGQYQAGQAQEGAAKYNAEVARGEAAFEEKQMREKAAHIMSVQRAMYGKMGVALNTPESSPLLILSHTAGEIEEEALNIRYRGYNRARMAEWEGRQYATAGTIGGISTFLSGLGSAATQYAAYRGAPGKKVT